MAFVRRSGDRFEIRESTLTPRGPRAKTLATFRILSDEVLDKAASRGTRPFDRETIRQRALALGAPTAPPAAFEAARQLAGQLARGNRPAPALAAHLAGALAGATEAARGLDSIDDVAEWIGRPLDRRGRELWQLLELVDALPTEPKRRRRMKPVFPRLVSTAP